MAAFSMEADHGVERLRVFLSTHCLLLAFIVVRSGEDDGRQTKKIGFAVLVRS